METYSKVDVAPQFANEVELAAHAHWATPKEFAHDKVKLLAP
jgi:hypothetical protein